MATKAKLHYSVILTKEAREAFLEDKAAAAGLMHGNKYFNCLKAVQNGYYLDMTIEFEQKLPSAPHAKFNMSVSIPNHAVLYIVSAEPEIMIGFRKEEGVDSKE